MTDAFRHLRSDLDSPAASAAAVTPHATDDLPGGVCRGIYVGGAGDVVAVLAHDTSSVTFKAVLAGTVLPVRAKAIRSSSTATFMIALY